MNSQILTVIACLGLGIALRKSTRFSPDSPRVLNAFVIWVSLPALVLVQFSKLLNESELSWDLAIPVSMPWLLFAISTGFFVFLGKALSWPKKQTGALVLLAGLGNTSFVGFPILESLLGERAIPYGILVDQPGSFLVLSTAGIFIASLLSPQRTGKTSLRETALRVFTFPPFIALLTTLAFALFRLSLTPALPTLEKLSGTLVPVALFSVGLQIRFSWGILQKFWRPVSIGLVFKLLVAPLLFYFFYCGLLGSQSFATQVTILESAMATMITAGVVAEEFGFEPQIVSLMLGISIPLSLITVPLWNYFLFN